MLGCLIARAPRRWQNPLTDCAIGGFWSEITKTYQKAIITMLYKIILNHFVCRHLLKTKCRQINYFCEKNRIKNNKNNALQDILKLLCLPTFAILAFFWACRHLLKTQMSASIGKMKNYLYFNDLLSNLCRHLCRQSVPTKCRQVHFVCRHLRPFRGRKWSRQKNKARGRPKRAGEQEFMKGRNRGERNEQR